MDGVGRVDGCEDGAGADDAEVEDAVRDLRGISMGLISVRGKGRTSLNAFTQTQSPGLIPIALIPATSCRTLRCNWLKDRLHSGFEALIRSYVVVRMI